MSLEEDELWYGSSTKAISQAHAKKYIDDQKNK